MGKDQFTLQELGNSEKKRPSGISQSSIDKLKSGLSLWTTALFILGEMAGSGVLAMPKAMADAGYAGFVLLVVFCFYSGYAGFRLGICWNILEERWPEYKQYIQSPYPSIGYRAYGRWMKIIVSICVDLSLFGVGVVYLLLMSQLIQSLLQNYVNFSFCYWILIIAAVLCPCMWLGTPKDFWFMGIMATITTVIAVILVIVEANVESDAIRADPAYADIQYNNVEVKHFFLAFGTVLFSFGGASTFPTLQIDMKKRSQFPWAILVGFIGLMIVYLPIAIVGFYFFGDKVNSNVLNDLKLIGTGQSTPPLVITCEILITVHLFPAFVIAVNPVAQELEGFFKVPNKFGWKRCVVRSILMVGLVFVAESIPKFGSMLDLVGGSTITALTFVFPPLFFMRLSDLKGDGTWPVRKIHIAERIFLWSMILIGVFGGCAATYAAVNEIVGPDSLCVPCYVPGGGNCK